MNRSLSFVGCGLLVVALGSVGCSSKKTTNAGGDSGTAGDTSTAGKSGAGGGKAGAGGKAGGGGASANLPMAECVSMSTAMGQEMSCATCGCMMDPGGASTCLKDANCLKLILCVRDMCPPLANGMNDTPCITSKCMAFLGGATPATAYGMSLTGKCASMCPRKTASGTDAGGGHDAGN